MKWEVKNIAGEFLRIVDEDNKTIADNVKEKHATLIAAAPELLEAAVIALADKDEPSFIRLRLREAIAKAEGK